MFDKIALAIFFGLMSGVGLRSLFFIPIETYLFLGLLTAGLLISYILIRRKGYVLGCLVFVGVLVGAARVETILPRIPDTLAASLGKQIEFVGTISEFPDVRETNQRLVIENRAGTRVLVVAPNYPKVTFGTEVKVRGILEHVEPFETDTGRDFRYDNFLAKERIYLVLDQAVVHAINSERTGIYVVLGAIYDTRNIFISGLNKALVEPQASLASGMLLGGKQGLGKSLLDVFIVTGLIHIVVLSGYNITIVAEAILRSLAFLGRRKSSIIAGSVIILFVFAAGAGAASVRAGIMACIAVFARYTGRTYDALRALLFAISLMVMLSPLNLVYDPGFQLSATATLGLILLSKKVEPYFSWIPIHGLREVVVSTVAAQISVLPLLLYLTGVLSWVALPANIVVLPAVPITMLFAFIAGIAGVISETVALVVSYPAHLLLTYTIFIAEAFSTAPFARLTVPVHSFLLTIGLYILLVGIFYKREIGQFLHQLLK